MFIYLAILTLVVIIIGYRVDQLERGNVYLNCDILRHKTGEVLFPRHTPMSLHQILWIQFGTTVGFLTACNFAAFDDMDIFTECPF